MKDAIRQRAIELGFDDCRFTTAAPPASAEKFQQWLAQKNHGEMTWLERSVEKRSEPQKVLAGAKSIIMLAVSYVTSAECRVTPAPRPASRITHHVPGAVACYAQFADYHDVLGERLKSLTQFVNQLGGAGTRSLWYVDTGPLLERDLAQRAEIGRAHV